MSAGTWRIAGTISRFPAARKPNSRVHTRSPHPPGQTSFYVSTLLRRCKLVLHGHGLQILFGGHCGLGFPSASTWIEFESAPASSRVPTRKSKNLFTMELLFEWIGKFNRGNVGFNSGFFAQNRKCYGFLKSEK